MEVQCLTTTDCPTETPVCADGTCRNQVRFAYLSYPYRLCCEPAPKGGSFHLKSGIMYTIVCHAVQRGRLNVQNKSKLSSVLACSQCGSEYQYCCSGSECKTGFHCDSAAYNKLGSCQNFTDGPRLIGRGGYASAVK